MSLPQSCARRAPFATTMRKTESPRLHDVRQLQCGAVEGAVFWLQWRGLQQVRYERADSQKYEARDGGTLAGPLGVRGWRQSRHEPDTTMTCTNDIKPMSPVRLMHSLMKLSASQHDARLVDGQKTRNGFVCLFCLSASTHHSLGTPFFELPATSCNEQAVSITVDPSRAIQLNLQNCHAP